MRAADEIQAILQAAGCTDEEITAACKSYQWGLAEQSRQAAKRKAYEAGDVRKVCAWCNEEFVIPAAKHAARRYCSDECRNEAARDAAMKRYAERKPSKCAVCGENIGHEWCEVSDAANTMRKIHVDCLGEWNKLTTEPLIF